VDSNRIDSGEDLSSINSSGGVTAGLDFNKTLLLACSAIN
jgi:hypothetical protein